MQLLKELPFAVEQEHLSREQAGPRSSSGSSTGGPGGQHPALEEQHYQALSSPEKPMANPVQPSSSQIGSATTSSSSVQGPEPSTAPMPAASNGIGDASEEAVEAMSLAADLADAISAVNLTDVLTDDSPFATAKVIMPGSCCRQPSCSRIWASKWTLSVS